MTLDFWVRAALLLLSIALPVLPAHAAYAKRYALVIGVSNYQNDKFDLRGPYGDATAMACRLADDFNYQVTRLLSPPAEGATEVPCKTTLGDAKEPNAANIREEWQRIVTNMNDGDIVAVFYAGHGVEFKGRNFLLASDAVALQDNDADISRLTQNAVDFHAMLEVLAEHQQDRPDIVGIFIIDACRENTATFQKGMKEVAEVGLKGGAMPPSEIFVMYSAGIGQLAADRKEGTEHSPFATAFFNGIKEPDDRRQALNSLAQKIKLAFYDDAVKAGAAVKQTPSYYNQFSIYRQLNGDPIDPKTIKLEPGTNPNEVILRHKDALIECTQCPEMVIIDERKSFVMGSLTGGGYTKPSGPLNIDYRFAIGRTEVTQRQWNYCVQDKSCKPRGVAQGLEKIVPPGDGERPITGVSWDDVQDYVRWMNDKATAATKGKYRLPTEAEWEFAARGGTDTDYSFKRERFDINADPLCRYANGGDASVGLLAGVYRHCSDGIGRETAIVGKFLPNDYGLHDVHGNVWEWVQDEWNTDHGNRPASACARGGDGQCAPAGDPGKDKIRVARGGSWRSGADALRSTSRNAFAQGHARGTLGFRVARSLD